MNRILPAPRAFTSILLVLASLLGVVLVAVVVRAPAQARERGRTEYVNDPDLYEIELSSDSLSICTRSRDDE